MMLYQLRAYGQVHIGKRGAVTGRRTTLCYRSIPNNEPGIDLDARSVRVRKGRNPICGACFGALCVERDFLDRRMDAVRARAYPMEKGGSE